MLREGREVIEKHAREWGLTPAEANVLIFVLKGYDLAEIARMRDTAVSTVRAQLTRVYKKAGVNSRSALATLLLEEGIVALPCHRSGKSEYLLERN